MPSLLLLHTLPRGIQEESPQKKKNTFLDPPGRQPTPPKKNKSTHFFPTLPEGKNPSLVKIFDPEPGHEAEVSTACHCDLPPWQGWWIAATSELSGKVHEKPLPKWMTWIYKTIGNRSLMLVFVEWFIHLMLFFFDFLWSKRWRTGQFRRKK